MSRGSSLLGLLGLLGLGCAPPPISSEGGESASTDSSGDGDGDPTTTGDGDGDPTTTGDGDGDGDPTTTGDGDGDPTTTGDGDGDGDPSACEPWQLECPDGVCRSSELGAFPCCAHGGDCAEGCEPQDAFDPAPLVCDEPGGFAWTGEGCRALCECVGADCGALFDTAKACLEAHDGVCGAFDFSACPFDAVHGPTLVEGTTPLGEASYRAGVFGLVYGEGGSPWLRIRMAASALELGNYIPHAESIDDYGGAVLSIFATAEPGVQVAWVSIANMWELETMATLDVSMIDTASPDSSQHTLVATLELDAPPWQLSGPIAIYGCGLLDMVLP